MITDIFALILSGVATIVSIIAIVVSIIHKKQVDRHAFYSSLEERFSKQLFSDFPSAVNKFIDTSSKTIDKRSYSLVDSCFVSFYSCLKCLDYLDDKWYEKIMSSLMDLEDSIMSIQQGQSEYNSERVKRMMFKMKNFYRLMRKFSLKH